VIAAGPTGKESSFPTVGWSRCKGGPLAVSLPGERAVGTIYSQAGELASEVPLYRRQQLVPMAVAVLCALAPAPARPASAERDAVRGAVDALLSQPPLLGARASVEVVSLDDGAVIYSRGADDQLNPASNTKLVTAAAALLRLGPEYRFTTDLLVDKPLDGHGRVRTLYVRGRADPTWNTERLYGLAADLWHRGIRQIGEIVLDDSYFDAEKWGPGWEQETTDKAYAAPVGALSLNHNAVAIYVSPGTRPGQRARVELEPDADCFVLQNGVTTIRDDGRRKLRPHTYAEGERTRVAVEGRLPARSEPVVLYRRVTDPAMYFGQTLRLALKQRRIQVGARVKRGPVPESAALLASYDSDELSNIIRDMNKVSSNFIAEMLVKTLGAELKGPPGTWPKGIEVTQELLAEVGIARGSYQLRNGSGLNDTNRFSAHQMIMVLTTVWKRFPIAADFVSSLGIAARDGTMRLRMEGTEAAGRLRAKTGTLEKVTALSGFVQSVGGDRFAFSVLVNDWSGRSGPVVSSVDRLGGILASAGMADKDALASMAPSELSPAELRARVATYGAMAKTPDKKNLSFLRSAMRSERDPIVRVMVADALVRSDPEQGGGPLLEAMPLSPELFAKLRAVGRELSLPVPAVSPLLDLAMDGSTEALARLLAIAPLARGPQHDEQLESALVKGFGEVADASPDELVAALRAAPSAQAQAGVELLAIGLTAAEADPARSAVARLLKESRGAEAAQAQGWIAVLERRVEPATPAAANSGSAAGVPSAQAATAHDATDTAVSATLPRAAHPISATTLAPVAAAAAAAMTATPAAVDASYVAAHPDWPITVVPNPAWTKPGTANPASTTSAAPAPASPSTQTPAEQACTADANRCAPVRKPVPGG
jgi:serine-type D-Ala-D-Ala carboxypeptidase/endopeptidase (penicillin-binding protein 4)